MTHHHDLNDVLGIDIGGANLKLADTTGLALCRPFAMWTEYARLGEQVQCLCEEFQLLRRHPARRLAVTMTGEMADCFATRRAGVAHILDQLAQAWPSHALHVYAVGGEWLSAEAARADPWRVAASNWFALAAWAVAQPMARTHPPDCVLDIGSTTVDVIPLHGARVATDAQTDRQRLLAGQLVYTGVQRTAVAAVVHQLEFRGRSTPIVAEKFATTDDAALLLGWREEADDDCDTADGQPRTRSAAHARLARMLGEDAETISRQESLQLADQIAAAQAHRIAEALRRNLSPNDDPPRVLVSGHGRQLAQRAFEMLDFTVLPLWLEDWIGTDTARAAPAMAVAWLLAHAGQALPCRSTTRFEGLS